MAPAWIVNKLNPKKTLTGTTSEPVYEQAPCPTIFIWDLKNTQQPPVQLSDHKGGVSSLVIDNNYLLSASYDKTIIVWQLPEAAGGAATASATATNAYTASAAGNSDQGPAAVAEPLTALATAAVEPAAVGVESSKPIRITCLRGFEGALHFTIMDGGDHLYAGTR